MEFIFKCVAVLAIFCVVFVLITPAPDELPCTMGHKTSLLSAVPAGIVPFFAHPLFSSKLIVADLVQPSSADVLSLTCTRLC